MRLFCRDKVYSPNDDIGGYTVLKVMGEGRYGICYLTLRDDRKFVVKQLKRGMFGRTANRVSFEAEILGSISHERIPRLISRISTPEISGYALEYMEGKTFDELIYLDNKVFRREEIIGIGRQFIRILKYLHAAGVIHGDIRVPNAVYNRGKVFLVDFGLSRRVDNCRYTADIDFSYLGDFLLHLYYTTYERKDSGSGPWFEELTLTKMETRVLKRLLGIEKRYRSVDELENDYGML